MPIGAGPRRPIHTRAYTPTHGRGGAGAEPVRFAGDFLGTRSGYSAGYGSQPGRQHQALVTKQSFPDDKGNGGARGEAFQRRLTSIGAEHRPDSHSGHLTLRRDPPSVSRFPLQSTPVRSTRRPCPPPNRAAVGQRTCGERTVEGAVKREHRRGRSRRGVDARSAAPQSLNGQPAGRRRPRRGGKIGPPARAQRQGGSHPCRRVPHGSGDFSLRFKELPDEDPVCL